SRVQVPLDTRDQLGNLMPPDVLALINTHTSLSPRPAERFHARRLYERFELVVCPSSAVNAVRPRIVQHLADDVADIGSVLRDYFRCFIHFSLLCPLPKNYFSCSRSSSLKRRAMRSAMSPNRCERSARDTVTRGEDLSHT